jgi:DNA-binding transcriptional MocR family regulator
VIHQAIHRGVLGSQGERLRAHYQHKRQVMEHAIASTLDGVMACTAPRGGFFLWGRLAGGLDAEAVLAHALEAKVSFVIGNAFYVDGSGPDTLRLSFSQPSDAELVEGISRLKDAIDRAR